jgi:hypothetical protein
LVDEDLADEDLADEDLAEKDLAGRVDFLRAGEGAARFLVRCSLIIQASLLERAMESPAAAAIIRRPVASGNARR